jgi:hypothetical protein
VKKPLPKDTFVMRGLTFRRDTSMSQPAWDATTQWGKVHITNTPLGEWFVGFTRHGSSVAHTVDRNMRKAFDRVQLTLVEMAKLEAP